MSSRHFPDSLVEATGLLGTALCQGPSGVSIRKEQSVCSQELSFQLGGNVCQTLACLERKGVQGVSLLLPNGRPPELCSVV